jgi:hypothetical protein
VQVKLHAHVFKGAASASFELILTPAYTLHYVRVPLPSRLCTVLELQLNDIAELRQPLRTPLLAATCYKLQRSVTNAQWVRHISYASTQSIATLCMHTLCSHVPAMQIDNQVAA